MTSLAFTVFGPPVPKARPRVVKGHTYTDPRTVSYENQVRTVALHSVAGARWPRNDPTFRFKVGIRFYRAAARGDIENLAKSILDAGNGILWKDDRQVTELNLWMGVDRTSPRAEVTVEVL